MKKRGLIIIAMFLAVALLTACGKTETGDKKEEKTDSKTKNITYLNKDYEIPANPKKIFVASVEPIEEMSLLGVKPYAVGKGIYMGDPPAEVKDTLSDVKWVDGGYEADKEQLLKLRPDLIFTTARMEPAVIKAYEKIAPTIPVSFSGEDSADTIKMIGAVTGKEKEADEAIEKYEQTTEQSKKEIADAGLADKKVMFLRISSEWGISAYNESITYNEILYDGLGFEVPEIIKNIERSDELPLEKLAQENPDYIFVLTPLDDMKAIEDLNKKPLWKQMKAVKDKHVFVNSVHPDLFGVPYLSKQIFIEKATSQLLDSK